MVTTESLKALNLFNDEDPAAAAPRKPVSKDHMKADIIQFKKLLKQKGLGSEKQKRDKYEKLKKLGDFVIARRHVQRAAIKILSRRGKAWPTPTKDQANLIRALVRARKTNSAQKMLAKVVEKDGVNQVMEMQFSHLV